MSFNTTSFLIEHNLDTSLYPITDVYYPIVGILIYILVDIIFSPSESQQKIPKKTGSIFTALVFLHNIGLAVFSMICFYTVFPIVWHNLTTSWENSICNVFSKELVGMNQTYGFWAWLFYLSKYYEFFDTWILLYKGRKPIFLQIYHHIGAVFVCWLSLVNRFPGFWIFVTFNSFIHSIMYIYYAASTLKIKIPFKPIITILQICQFIFGIGFASAQLYLFYPKCYQKTQLFSSAILQLYVSILVYMFTKFYKKTYKSKKKNVKLQNKKID